MNNYDWYHINPEDFFVTVRGKFDFDGEMRWYNLQSFDLSYILDREIEEADGVNSVFDSILMEAIVNYLKFHAQARDHFTGDTSFNIHFFPGKE